MSRKKLATVWLGGCSGCHMSLLDIDERILDVMRLADIVKSPVVDARNARRWTSAWWRARSAPPSTWRSCSTCANRPGCWWPSATARSTATSRPCATAWAARPPWSGPTGPPRRGDNVGPIPTVGVTPLTERVTPLHEHVKVDVWIPGCPPSADLIFYVVRNCSKTVCPT